MFRHSKNYISGRLCGVFDHASFHLGYILRKLWLEKPKFGHINNPDFGFRRLSWNLFVLCRVAQSKPTWTSSCSLWSKVRANSIVLEDICHAVLVVIYPGRDMGLCRNSLLSMIWHQLWYDVDSQTDSQPGCPLHMRTEYKTRKPSVAKSPKIH